MLRLPPSRYTRVRFWSARGVSPAYIHDRRLQRLTPAEPDWRREDLWGRQPTRGVGANWSRQGLRPILGAYVFANGAVTATALDSAYVVGVSGDAVGTRFMTLVDRVLTDVYAYVASYGGTAALVTSLDCEIRTAHATAIQLPLVTAGGLLGSGVVNPGGVAGWVRFPFTIPLTAGVPYWRILGDVDGNATHYLRVGSSFSNVSNLVQDSLLWQSSITTTGWTNAALSDTAHSSGVHGYADGSVQGDPFTNVAAVTSGTYQRGYALAGLPFSVRLFGLAAPGLAATAFAQIWSGTSGPTGTPYAAPGPPFVMSTNVVGGTFADGPALLEKDTPYRLVLGMTSASTLPYKMSIGVGADATLRKAMMGGGIFTWTQDTAGVWVDDVNALPALALLIEDFGIPAVGGGGGGGGPPATGRQFPFAPAARL